jgi:hypothetical protein
VADVLLGARVSPIDLGIVGQLARLSEARIERLARLPRALLALVPVRFEQVTPAVSQNDCAVVGVEGRGPDQPLAFQVPQGLASIAAAVMEIAPADDAEGTDGSEYPGFGSIDLVYPIALSDRPALTPARQVKVLGEYVTRIALASGVAFAAAAATSSVAIRGVPMITVTA